MDFERFTMIYYAKKIKNNLRILGDSFVKNNKNKGNLIILNKKYNLKEFHSIDNIKEDQIKIGLIYNKYIFNKSFIFKNCKALIHCTFHDDNDFLENDNKSIKYIENSENEKSEDKTEKKTEINEEENIMEYDNLYNKLDNPLSKMLCEEHDYSTSEIACQAEPLRHSIFCTLCTMVITHEVTAI